MGLAIVMAVALQAAAQPASPPRPKYEWTARPKADDLSRLYPVDAWRRDIEGETVLECRFTETGALTDCKATGESPPGFGFAEAVLQMAPLFQAKVSPGMVGQPVKIPVAFRIPHARGEARLKKPLIVTAPNLLGFAEVSCLVDKAQLEDCRVTKASPQSLEAYAMAAAGKLSPGDIKPGTRFIIPFEFEPKTVATDPAAKPYEVEFAPLKSSEKKYSHLGPTGPYYPQKAADLHISGAATLHCRAGDAGELQNCSPVSEAPDGTGFGFAARSMAYAKRIKAVGAPPAGQIILVRVPFTLGAPATVE